jgi:hypothetical protein
VALVYGLNFTPAPGNSLEAVTAAMLDAKRLGCTMVRKWLTWSVVQPSDSSHWTWSTYDTYVTAAQTVGIDILWVLANPCPAWAATGSMYPPTSNAEFAAFCGAAAGRYGAQGFHYYEVWNEPDLAEYWLPAPNATDYAALLSAANTAIKAADASAFVISGPLYSPWSATDYLPGLITASFYNHCDAMGLHPYCKPFWPQDTNNQLNPFRMITAVGSPWSIISKLTTAGVPNFPIWCTEFGIESYSGSLDPSRQTQSSTVNYYRDNPPNHPNCGTEGYQADVLTNAITRLKLISNVQAFFWYRGVDDLSGGGNRYGLNRADGTHKPAWQAYATAIAS